MTIVAGAVTGDDLESVAAAAAAALGHAVAIALPASGRTVAFPPGAIEPEHLAEITRYAVAVIRGDAGDAPSHVADVVPIRIGSEVIGIVAGEPGGGPQPRAAGESPRPWLEAAAAGAAVTALMREARAGDADESRRGLLRALSIGPPADVTALVGHARRLGFDLSEGAVAICAEPGGASAPEREAAGASAPDRGAGGTSALERRAGELVRERSALVAELGGGRLLGLVPPTRGNGGDPAGELASALTERGMRVATSALHRDPSALHDAVCEAELLLELESIAAASLSGQEETYRLLIGVLLRKPEELTALRAGTISPLEAYDAEHDTELLATLEAFLLHDGSTTETAEAMRLHRHTVGYRLARVQEVSGLSPYESEGRERLSLGLKAHQILEAARRRSRRL
ncbi:MAG: helix-turn-helix domain-containing protein [Solirubrobacterales bacterium]|nr:helix-turn-helix domain-containing protein [Solirubrobacterales bacterium]MBV9717254.1 helix-turn-helix domain-containing protein [Solirubrobacterales bacterium]